MIENRARTCKDRCQVPATAGTWVSGDPSLHEQAVKPWELLTSSLSRGPFRHDMRYLSAPSFCLYSERFACRLRLRGQSPPGHVGLAVPIRVPAQSLCWKAPWSTERLPAITDDALDALLDAGHEQLIVLVGRALLQRELGEGRAEKLERLFRSRSLPSSERRVAHLRAFLLALIDEAHVSPDLLRHSMTVQAIETDLIRNLTAAVAAPLETQPARRSRRERAGRGSVVARVLEYVRATNPLDLSIPQLCEAAGVEQRSLEYAFRETFDLTPLGFLRLRRLHSARYRLIAADPADMAVTDIAYQEGFYHRGRFAAAYMSTFGEHPSQTLHRPCPKEFRPLVANRPFHLGERRYP